MNITQKRKFKDTYDNRANDEFEEKCDVSRNFRIPFYFRYCLPISSNIKVLDIGAADGLVIEKFLECGVGSDIAVQYCNKMKNKGVKSVCCIAEFLPFRKGAFDYVIASAVLEHVFDLKKCVAEITNLLEEGDLLLINVPYMEDLTPYIKGKYEFSHLRSFDEKYLISLFKNFDVKHLVYHDFNFFYSNITSPLINRMAGIAYNILPKRFRWALMEIRWTKWIKPFSITMIFQKRA